MTSALAEAFRDRWTQTDELLTVIAQEVHLLWRQQMVNGGKPDPGALELHRPGQKPKQGGGLGALVRGLRRS